MKSHQTHSIVCCLRGGSDSEIHINQISVISILQIEPIFGWVTNWINWIFIKIIIRGSILMNSMNFNKMLISSMTGTKVLSAPLLGSSVPAIGGRGRIGRGLLDHWSAMLPASGLASSWGSGSLSCSGGDILSNSYLNGKSRSGNSCINILVIEY